MSSFGKGYLTGGSRLGAQSPIPERAEAKGEGGRLPTKAHGGLLGPVGAH